jgi:hypothetical protein
MALPSRVRWSDFFIGIRSGAAAGDCWRVAGDDSSISRRLLQAFSFVLGVIVLAAVAYREGWEAVLFLLIFLAIWHLGSYRAVG